MLQSLTGAISSWIFDRVRWLWTVQGEQNQRLELLESDVQEMAQQIERIQQEVATLKEETSERLGELLENNQKIEKSINQLIEEFIPDLKALLANHSRQISELKIDSLGDNLNGTQHG